MQIEFKFFKNYYIVDEKDVWFYQNKKNLFFQFYGRLY